MKSFSDGAPLTPLRSAAINEMSMSAETVKTGIVVADPTIRRAMVA